MTDKELIKKEIERIEKILDDFNKTHNNTIDNGIVSAKKNICKHIKSFIDSLTEEATDEANFTIENEDLEEEILCRWEDDPHTLWPKCPYSDFKNIAHHFAEWQKQQMMKDAVDAEVFVDYNINFGYGSLTANIDLDEQHLKEGDKVKIIIVKED